MKSLSYVIAVISITIIASTRGQENPSTHQNGALVNDERCGSQPSIEEAVPFTSYPKGVQPVEPGEYPWLVMVSIENLAHFVGESPYTTCMGSIISKRFVLTASSCFSLYGTENASPRPRSIIISAGEINLSTTPHCDDDLSCPLNVYIGESVKYYKNNGPAESGKNIALVKTTQTIFFHDTVLPICLQHDSLLYPPNFWGEIGIRVTASDQNLQQVGGHILTEEENTVLHESHLPGEMRSEGVNSVFGIGGTASEVYHDSDIGGPLMIKKPIDSIPPRFYLYGIRSFKAETPVPPYASTFVYTKVSHYLEWILDNINQNLQQVGGHILTEEENIVLHESHLLGDMRSEDVNSVFGIGGTASEVYHDSDIGGPLMIKKPIDSVPPRFYLYGICSFKAETPVPPYASTFVYTKVSHYLEWILDNISE